MTTLTASKWVRVNKRNPCPICDKPDWCLISQDGNAAICARVKSDKQAGEGGWLHRLSEGHPPLPLPPKPAKELPRAPVDIRDRVYRALLGELSLSDTHSQSLLARGLTAADVRVLNYRSLPLEGRFSIVRRLTGEGFKLAGVPGFALVNGEVRLCGSLGILIPIRDIQGWIVGLQVRCDHQTEGGKYKWLSSAGKPYGVSSGAPIHVARVPAGIEASDLWVTEGALKGDIASLKLCRTVLAVAGVGNWHGLIPIVKELRPSRVIVAFDMDKLTNPAVNQCKNALINRLLELDIKVFEASWNSEYKGLDDLVTIGD